MTITTEVHPRTTVLRQLMDDHKLTAAQVGALIGRKAHTVRVWRSVTEDRIIPEHTLEVLRMKLRGHRKVRAA